MISTLSNNSSITTTFSLVFTILKNSTSRYVLRGLKSGTVQSGSKETITWPERCKQAKKSEINSVLVLVISCQSLGDVRTYQWWRHYVADNVFSLVDASVDSSS